MRLVVLKSFTDDRGSLTVIDGLHFPIARGYFLHDIKPGAMRGGHAHRKAKRIYVAVAGGLDADVNGEKARLDYPQIGMLIEPMEWVELTGFSPGAVCLILTSMEHDEGDVMRDRAEFERLKP